ncbi:hypothetical protein ACMXYX_18100 (plasmid) [Neptuniibacter sp. QD72_48]|uniref:hypothetical protein n=1 Tax=Neptuniibacter sp. QD72_48 TaxID=3398214 RepID=UPI0039F52F0C
MGMDVEYKFELHLRDDLTEQELKVLKGLFEYEKADPDNDDEIDFDNSTPEVKALIEQIQKEKSKYNKEDPVRTLDWFIATMNIDSAIEEGGVIKVEADTRWKWVCHAYEPVLNFLYQFIDPKKRDLKIGEMNSELSDLKALFFDNGKLTEHDMRGDHCPYVAGGFSGYDFCEDTLAEDIKTDEIHFFDVHRAYQTDVVVYTAIKKSIGNIAHLTPSWIDEKYHPVLKFIKEFESIKRFSTLRNEQKTQSITAKEADLIKSVLETKDNGLTGKQEANLTGHVVAFHEQTERKRTKHKTDFSNLTL